MKTKKTTKRATRGRPAGSRNKPKPKAKDSREFLTVATEKNGNHILLMVPNDIKNIYLDKRESQQLGKYLLNNSLLLK